jgi:MFS transporter, DHA1 family, inner membrane transport protein
MPLALLALSLAVFSVGTAELIIAGILPDLSADFGIDIPTAGLLVTCYAVAVAIGGPIFAVLTSRLPRKPLIVGVMVLFVLGQGLCALAPSYDWLMAARILVACGHGLFFGAGSVAAADLVPPGKRGAALAVFLGGFAVATVLGVPLGTAVGNAFGWRWSFWAIGAIALLATILVAALLPSAPPERRRDAGLKAEIKALGHQQVYLSYVVIGLVMTGTLAFATYQVPVLINVTGVAQDWTPAYLVLGGIGTALGIFVGGRAADWRLMPTLIVVLIGQAIAGALLLPAVGSRSAMIVCLFLWGALGSAFDAPVQSRILAAARQAPNLAATLVSTAFNVGIALGAWLGGLWIAAGLGYQTLPVASILCSLLAAALAVLSWVLDRRDRRIALA